MLLQSTALIDEAMKQAIRSKLLKAGTSAAITLGLWLFWLVGTDATPADVNALIQRGSQDQRTASYLQEVLPQGVPPSRGRLLLIQMRVDEIHKTKSVPPHAAAKVRPWIWLCLATATVVLAGVTLAFAISLYRPQRS